VDTGNDRRRGVKSVESRALSGVVFLRRQQRLEFFPDCLPAGILETAANRIGKDREGNRPEAGEAGKYLFFLRSCDPLILLDGLEGADGGEDVAGFGLFATGDGSRSRSRFFWRVIRPFFLLLNALDGRGKWRILVGDGWLCWR
jgi:hypothetical protein